MTKLVLSLILALALTTPCFAAPVFLKDSTGNAATSVAAPTVTNSVANWNGTAINWALPNFTWLSGNATVAQGGTGAVTLTIHGVVIGNTTSAVNVTSAGTSGQVLTSNGASADPTFQAAAAGTVTSFSAGNLSPLFTTSVGTSTSTPALTFALSTATANQAYGTFSSTTPAFGTVNVASGGTGATTLTIHGVLIGNTTSAIAATSAGTAGQVLTSNGASADPTFQAAGGSGLSRGADYAVSVGNIQY